MCVWALWGRSDWIMQVIPLYVYNNAVFERNILKGLFTIFCLSFKSHILDSNGVWYSWFWPEGSINAQNSTFLGFHFVPRDLDSRRRGPRLAAPLIWVKVPFGAASRGPGHKIQTQKFWVPAKISYTTPHYYPKYEIWTIQLLESPCPFVGDKICRIIDTCTIHKCMLQDQCPGS